MCKTGRGVKQSVNLEMNTAPAIGTTRTAATHSEATEKANEAKKRMK